MRLKTYTAFAVPAVFLFVLSSLARPPANYYDTVDDSSPSILRSTLHDVIDDHTRYPYTSTATDTWDILDIADEDPNNSTNILDVYKNSSYPKAGGGNTNYNREHVWPNSYGFPNNVVSNIPYTDMHALFLCDSGYNSSRGNTLFRNCVNCDERVTVGGTTGVYPGTSNWRQGTGMSGSWEVWIDRRGDIARAMLYLDIRYSGDVASEPDLILTNNETLVVTTGQNESIAHMGMLNDLLQWHKQDPVDEKERARNEVIYIAQGNRNPFIDEPLWVSCIFEGVCAIGDVIFEDGFESGDTSNWELGSE